MQDKFKVLLWEQLGAAIDMLENAIDASHDSVWSDPSKKPEWPSHDVPGYWYLVYHTLFWLDHDVSDTKDFRPPSPFNLDEMDPAGLLPERPYTREEMRRYLEHARRKCRECIRSLDEKEPFARRSVARPEFGLAELLLYTLRHVQHHTAQLNLILRQKIDSAPRWVRKAKIALTD